MAQITTTRHAEAYKRLITRCWYLYDTHKRRRVTFTEAVTNVKTAVPAGDTGEKASNK